MKLAPEEERVIDREHQNTGKRKHDVISAIQRQKSHPAGRNGGENDDCDQEANRDEGNWRQIAQPDFDCEPGRAPNDAESEPRRWNPPTDALHSPRYSRGSSMP